MIGGKCLGVFCYVRRDLSNGTWIIAIGLHSRKLGRQLCLFFCFSVFKAPSSVHQMASYYFYPVTDFHEIDGFWTISPKPEVMAGYTQGVKCYVPPALSNGTWTRTLGLPVLEGLHEVCLRRRTRFTEIGTFIFLSGQKFPRNRRFLSFCAKTGSAGADRFRGKSYVPPALSNGICVRSIGLPVWAGHRRVCLFFIFSFFHFFCPHGLCSRLEATAFEISR